MSSNPISDIAEGQRKAELNFTKEQVVLFIKNVKEGKSGIFNELSSAIQSVRIQRDSSEWRVYNPYIKDTRLRKLANYGLQLRLAEKDTNRRDFLLSKVDKKYGLEGRHIAEFVWNKVLSKLILSVMDVNKTQEQLTIEIEQVLNNIERDVTFIHSDTNVKETSENLISKLKRLSPELHIITSKANPRRKCKSIKENICKVVKNYNPQEYPEGDEYVVIFRKIPDTRPMYP